MIKVFYHHIINPCAGNGCKFVSKVGNSCWCLLWTEVFDGVRFESHHTRLETTLFGCGDKLFEQRLMPPMHTIKITDGEGAGGPMLCGRDTSYYLHVEV